MAKLGQIKSGTMRVGNTTASGYGIVYADEVIGHRRVNTYTDLANIPDWCLYNKAGGETTDAAIGQLWYVTTGDTSGHSAGLYQLTGWSNNTKTWTFFKNGANVSTHDTTYTFANGSNGSFTVTPKGGTAQTVSIGKPATAGTADHAKTADSATKADSATSATNATNATNADHATSADSATSATKATQDKNGRDIVDTYATKSQVSALSSALVYRGTVDAKYALPTKNVKVGDVYVVAAAGTFAGQTCEPGDMIIAQTASNAEGTPAPTWTVVQTNINGAVTTTENLTASKLIVGNSNKSIKVATGSGLVKLTEGVVSYDNNTYLTTTSASNTYATKTDLSSLSSNAVTTASTLGDGKLIVGSNNKAVRTITASGFVKVDNGTVNIDTSTYLTSVPKATTSVVGGGKVVNVYSETAAITNTNPKASNVTLYGLQIDKDGNFYTPVKDAAVYSLPTASNTVLGGIKTGFTKNDSAKNYPVELSGDKAYVHVPWTDTNTTYTADGVYVTLTSGQFSLAHGKKTLIDNAIQPDNIEDEDGILTHDKFGYLYHQIKTDLSDKYVCKDLVKSYVSVRIIQHDAPVAGGANMTGALVFCASAPATNEGVYTGKFGQYQTGSTGNIYSNDVTWALDAATDLIVVDQNGNEYTVTSGTSVTLTPRAIQTSAITKLF